MLSDGTVSAIVGRTFSERRGRVSKSTYLTNVLVVRSILLLGVPQAESDSAPILVCGPHTTWWDAKAIVLAAQCPGGVSRTESAQVPVLGRMYT